MKLIWKFNLVLLGIFLLGFAIAGYVSYGVLQANAREEIVQNARLMMEAALASRTYTNTQVKPLLETQLKYAFLPQTVPAYAATEVFNEMRKPHRDYVYKEATLNPTNPRDRASEPSTLIAIIWFHSKACCPINSWMPIGTVRIDVDFVSVSAKRNSFQHNRKV